MTTTVLTIKTEEYSLEVVPPNPAGRWGGFTLVCLSSPETRTYYLKCNQEGLPYCCSCPAFLYSDPHECKHRLRVIEWMNGK